MIINGKFPINIPILVMNRNMIYYYIVYLLNE